MPVISAANRWLLSLGLSILYVIPLAHGAQGKEAGKAKAEKKTTAAKEAPPTTAVDNKSPYNEEAIHSYNKGVDLHQSGHLNQAIEAYRAAIAADGRMEEAYSNLGLIYAAQRNYSKAIDAFNEALALKPSRPKTLNGLGTVLYARGRLKDALEKWQKAIEIDPNFAPAYFNMGNALENERDSAAALDAYVKAIKIDAGMSDAYYRLGTLLNKDKHPAQAMLFLSKAVELAPEADFCRDAKKQLSSIESQFSHEGPDSGEVKMSIMPPRVEDSDKAP